MKSFWKTVLLTGLLVGTTDLITAYVDQYIKTGKFADKMLYFIAGGALGLEKAIQGGFLIGLLGLLFHYFIAFSFTVLFFLLYRPLRLNMLNMPLLVLVGLLYGPFVGSCMRFLILPLSKIPQNGFNLGASLIGWSILGIVLGIPIAVSARWFYNVNKK